MKNKRQNKGKASSDKNPETAQTSITLNVADYITTKRTLNTGGEELNPVAYFLIRKSKSLQNKLDSAFELGENEIK